MARARNIKPGFFTHEQMAENDPLGRLLFLGLTTIADFKGDLEWRPKRIKIQLLPYDECNTELLAINLDKSGFVRFYSDGEKIYLHVVNFEKHQNPHKNEREAGSEIPAYTEEMRQAIDLNTLAIKTEEIAINLDKDGTAPADSLIPHPDSLIPDSLKKPFAETDKSVPAVRTPKAEFNYSTSQFENLSVDMLAAWRDAFPAIDVRQEIAKAKAWLLANPKNRKSNIDRFLTNWLTRAQDNAPRVQHENHQRASGKPNIDWDDTSWADGLGEAL